MNVFEELRGGRDDDFQKKAIKDGDSYKLYMKYNGEWLFSGRYSKEELLKMGNIIIN